MVLFTLLMGNMFKSEAKIPSHIVQSFQKNMGDIFRIKIMRFTFENHWWRIYNKFHPTILLNDVSVNRIGSHGLSNNLCEHSHLFHCWLNGWDIFCIVVITTYYVDQWWEGTAVFSNPNIWRKNQPWIRHQKLFSRGTGEFSPRTCYLPVLWGRIFRL